MKPIISFLLSALAITSTTVVASINVTTGTCSPLVVVSQGAKTGNITIAPCTTNGVTRKELEKLADQLNSLKLSSDQVAKLAHSVNLQLTKLGERLMRLESNQDKLAIDLQELSKAVASNIQNSSTLKQIESAVETAAATIFAKPGPTLQDRLGTPIRVYDAIASSERARKLGARRAIDGEIGHAGSPANTWVTKQGETVGAWIELLLDKTCTITEVTYHSNFGKHTNSQIRSATIAFANHTSQLVKFEQVSGIQKVKLAPTETSSVRLIVDDVFPNGRADSVQVFELGVSGYDCH